MKLMRNANIHTSMPQLSSFGNVTVPHRRQKGKESGFQVDFHELSDQGIDITSTNIRYIKNEIDLVISEARDDYELEDIDENMLNQIVDDTTTVLKEIYKRDFYIPEISWSPDESIMLVWYLEVGLITISLYGDKTIIYSLHDGESCKMSGFFKSDDSVMLDKSLEITYEKLRNKGLSHI